ncbi:MAG: hypothetical protein KatS3mg026_1779 [Bacteroidia bacterium]|nr:MAG: hypothetical protein KatS3mg026_1779 [Bacteroidia bacterium]
MELKAGFRRLLRLFARLDIRPEMEDPQRILESMAQDATFRGINLWVLITATLVASVGLNVNSTAVIIGAMLISPLMGPHQRNRSKLSHLRYPALLSVSPQSRRSGTF